ncbi:MAG: hypothetical protein MHMPM18_003391, partial [Marteilia pararefringens]
KLESGLQGVADTVQKDEPQCDFDALDRFEQCCLIFRDLESKLKYFYDLLNSLKDIRNYELNNSGAKKPRNLLTINDLYDQYELSIEFFNRILKDFILADEMEKKKIYLQCLYQPFVDKDNFEEDAERPIIFDSELTNTGF